MTFKVALASLFLVLLLGCSLQREAVAPGGDGDFSRWAVRLNSLGGAAHDGEFRLLAAYSGPSLVGSFQSGSDRCVRNGTFEGARQGNVFKGVVFEGGNSLELDFAREGELFFGVYKFTGGDCRGDWGSATVTELAPDKKLFFNNYLSIVSRQ